MFKTVARILLLRVLPRRLLPVITVVEAALLLRSVRRRSKRPVNEPAASRTGLPPSLESAGISTSRSKRR
jgi:hypothetical protein